MKKPKIKMSVVKEEAGYSAFATIGHDFIGTQGEDYEELKKNVLEAVNLNFKEEGLTYTEDEISYELDLPSFFDFYKVINAKALSQRIGMNQSLLAQYVNGIKKPSEKQVNRILEGVRQVGRELSQLDIAL